MKGVRSQKTKNPRAPWSQSSRRAQRRAEAIARAEACAKLTSVERLAKLDAKLGAHVGAKRERVRLNLQSKRQAVKR